LSVRLRRFVLPLAAIVILTGAASSLERRGRAAHTGPRQPPQQQPVFRTATQVVAVTVSVMRGRQPVTDLTAADFVLTDNGARQTVDSILGGSVALDVTLATTGGYHAQREGIISGAIEADRVATLLGPDDRLFVVAIGDRVRRIAIDARERLAEAAERRELTIIPGVSLIDGFFYALAQPVGPGRRHLIVGFTGGSGRWSTLEAARLPQLADRSDAVLHAAFWASPDDTHKIQVPGQTDDMAASLKALAPGPMSPRQLAEWRETHEALSEAVRRTGGTVRRVSNSQRAFEEILADFRQSYVLHYTPTGVAPGGWHEIKVSIARPGSFSVRARRGYQGF
jgi:hypothetical protein